MRWLRTFMTTLGMTRHGTVDDASHSPLPSPAIPIYVIGDLHGRLDLLDLMLARIAARPDGTKARIIVLGDMIDRGPQSAGVLARLSDRVRRDPARIFCLMGNHERMMLDFLQDPVRHAPRWLAAGGSDTLASFGLRPWAQRGEADPARRLIAQAAALRSALGPDRVKWLENLPLYWQEGRLAVTHAGADPAVPIPDQDSDTLLWGHSQFFRQRRSDGVWIVHGHTVVETAQATQGWISVDTGAWRSGCLSAARIGEDGISFLTETEPQG